MPRPKFSYRSKLTNILLILLYDTLAPTWFLANITGEPSKKVSRYLTYLKKSGLVKYVNGFWTLTEKGKEHVENLNSIYKYFALFFNNNDLNNYFKNKRYDDNLTTKILKNTTKISNNTTKTMIIQLKDKLETTKTLDQILLKAKEFLGRELNNVEKAILEFLFSFSISRDRKYWWPEDGLNLPEALAFKLSKILGISISSIDIGKALRELEAAGIIFITYDERRKVPKIRISKSLFP